MPNDDGCGCMCHIRAITVPRPGGGQARIAIDWPTRTITVHENGREQPTVRVQSPCRHAVIPELSRIAAYLAPDSAPPTLPSPQCQQPGGKCYGAAVDAASNDPQP